MAGKGEARAVDQRLLVDRWSISASVTCELAAKRARTTLRQLMPTEMKSRTVSGGDARLADRT
jgi:hypothetical protein